MMPRRVRNKMKKRIIADAHRLNALVEAFAKANAVHYRPRGRIMLTMLPMFPHGKFYGGPMPGHQPRWRVWLEIYHGQLKASRPEGRSQEEALREMHRRILEAIDEAKAGEGLEYLSGGCWRP